MDEAVKNEFVDPTGGRRTGGDMDKKLNEEDGGEKRLLESAA